MHQPYDLVKCPICAIPWPTHDRACSGERHRLAKMEEFQRLEDARALAVILTNSDRVVAPLPPWHGKTFPRKSWFRRMIAALRL